jgi:hypothetical protein
MAAVDRDDDSEHSTLGKELLHGVFGEWNSRPKFLPLIWLLRHGLGIL